MESSLQEGLPFVSIVIPTLNRRNRLRVCLNSLLNLNYPQSKMEIIIVDGDSNDGTKEMVQAEYTNVKLAIDKREGISYARNAGGKMAQGNIIAFTDDDCVVDKDWLTNLVTAFHNDKIAAVGGPVTLLNPGAFPRKLVESPTLGTFSSGSIECKTRVLITANLAVRKKVFENIKFNVLFGRRKSLLYKWEEDVEFSQRLLDSGYELLYVPTAKVYHDTSPSRAAFKYVITKEFSGGLSHFMVERKYKKRATLGVNYFRNLTKAIFSFYQTRTINSFCFLIKMWAIVIATIFVP
jgi:GT2 family glycosyltransferase